MRNTKVIIIAILLLSTHKSVCAQQYADSLDTNCIEPIELICQALKDKLGLFGLGIKRDDGSRPYFKGDIIIVESSREFSILAKEYLNEWGYTENPELILGSLTDYDKHLMIAEFYDQKSFGGKILFSSVDIDYSPDVPRAIVSFTNIKKLSESSYCLELWYNYNSYLICYTISSRGCEYILNDWIQTSIE